VTAGAMREVGCRRVKVRRREMNSLCRIRLIALGSVPQRRSREARLPPSGARRGSGATRWRGAGAGRPRSEAGEGNPVFAAERIRTAPDRPGDRFNDNPFHLGR